MNRRPVAIFLLVLMTIFSAACGPEAKKKRAMEGGNKYFEKGQYKQARLMYLNAVKADPRFGEAYYQLALTNIQLGSFGDAIGNLQRTIELMPENLDAHSKLADIYLSVYSNNPVKHKALLADIRDLAARLEKRGKGSFEELRLRASILLADGKGEEALELYREADRKKPGQAIMHLTIARTLISLKRNDEAAAYLRGLLDKDKSFGAGYDTLYAIKMMESKLDEAGAVLLERMEANPKEVANRLRLAAHYYVAKKPAELQQVLDGTLAKYDQFPNAFLDVADFYYRVRDYDRAAVTYIAGAKRDPSRERLFEKRLIEVRVAQNRSQEALELCEKILKSDPKDPEAIAMRASLWLYAGKPEQINTAISELQSVVAKMPDNFVLRFNLGRALMSKGDVDGARVQFTDALATRPDYLPARLALAQIQVTRGEFGAAMSAADEIIRLDPGNQFARLIKANALLSMGKFEDSKVILQDTIKLNPNQLDAKYQLGYVLFKEGKYKEAEVHFREIYSRTPPDIRGLVGLTEIFTSQGQYDAALKLIDEAMVKFPKSSLLQVAWANVAVRGGRTDEGVAMYRKALVEDPKNFDIHMRIAESYRQKGDLAHAIETWKQAGDLRPNHVGPIINRAMALDQVNRKTEAAPLYEQVLKAEPDNIVALNNYSYYLADNGSNLDLALSYAQKAKSKAPSDPMVADTLGFIYLKKNLPQNAASIFSELTAKHPNVALFHIRLATAYLQSGDKLKAKASLESARRNNPSQSDKDEIDKLASKLG